jgi:hypothetical protein
VAEEVVAVLGTYRKGGTLDRVVEAILEGARARRAATHHLPRRQADRVLQQLPAMYAGARAGARPMQPA